MLRIIKVLATLGLLVFLAFGSTALTAQADELPAIPVCEMDCAPSGNASDDSGCNGCQPEPPPATVDTGGVNDGWVMEDDPEDSIKISAEYLELLEQRAAEGEHASNIALFASIIAVVLAAIIIAMMLSRKPE